MSLAGLLVLLGGVVAALAGLRRLTPAPAPRRLLVLGLLPAGLWLWSSRTREPAPTTEPTPGIQTTPAPEGYVTSAACRSCHPSEYQSWHQSYHRSMTESARADSVRAPWQGVQSDGEGHELRLFRRGTEVWVEMPDPDRLAAGQRPGLASAGAPRVERQVVMTTGSHHYQGYWVPGLRGNELWQLPVVYHFESQRFLPRRAVFLEPADDPAYWARWNSSCVQCHSVAGQPRHDLASDRFDTRAAELGIACEACHGPGAEHVARQQNPLTRYQTRWAAAGDPSIVQPARLDARRASEICGQCHAYFVPEDAERWWQSGFVQNYRPGADLARSHRVLDYERDREQARELIGSDLDSLFYADGSVRVGGREWNGLMKSGCFERGRGDRQIRCTSCHQLHGGTRESQLSESALSNAACTACHSELLSSEHTHHLDESSGSSCVNCHMPYTSYALLGSVRSHRITRPTLEAGGAPNACNACHQDRSLAWTASWLQRWYGRPPTPGKPGAGHAYAAATALLSGDAATRVVVADQLGWAPALAVSGSGWQAQLLAEALDDPYTAVRFVAHRSLRRLPGFEDFRYDFIADRAERLEARELARRRSRELARQPADESPPDLPLDARGRIVPAFLAEWVRSRDPRPVRIAE
jgi:Cytochrome c552/Cytochrome c554 and c-prime